MLSTILTSGTNTGTGGGLGGTLILILVFVVFIVFYYFTSIKPARKQEKETQDMRSSLAPGDEITTIGGIIGRVLSVTEETVLIETSGERTKIRILKSSVARIDVKADGGNKQS